MAAHLFSFEQRRGSSDSVSLLGRWFGLHCCGLGLVELTPLDASWTGPVTDRYRTGLPHALTV
jgi:hypothetical protein